jgi:hypothetical protein
MRNIVTNQLRRMGWSDEMIGRAKIDGKPASMACQPRAGLAISSMTINADSNRRHDGKHRKGDSSVSYLPGETHSMKMIRVHANRRAAEERRRAVQERTRQARIASQLLADVTGRDFRDRYWLRAEDALDAMRAYLATNQLAQEQSHLWLSNIDAGIRREVEDVA